MHAYAQMKVHADPQAQAMAEIINAGEEEVREGGDTPNMVDAEYQTEYQTGHEPTAAEAVAQMEIDLQGVDGGVSDGGAEGDMAEVAWEEGAVSEDSFEFTDRSSSVIEVAGPCWHCRASASASSGRITAGTEFSPTMWQKEEEGTTRRPTL